MRGRSMFNWFWIFKRIILAMLAKSETKRWFQNTEKSEMSKHNVLWTRFAVSLYDKRLAQL